ncbi:MAG: hypothetical protein Q4D79_00160 [Propionibacteriaceae bacterium]|nr:hypothetical protein [Propionibacteriaceae bacterium]
MSLLRLHRILREHRGPLRADLRREYGIDLDAALAPDFPDHIPPPVLLDLIDGLSPQATYWRAVDPDRATWGLTDHLLATLIDDLRVFMWEFGGKRGKRPDPIPRPGVESPEEVTVIGASKGFDSIEEFQAWYQGRRNN